MVVASLVPSATEMLYALGLGDSVAGVTHECDYPPGAEQLPHLTRSVIPDGLPAAEIDRAVRERTAKGESLYELNVDTLDQLGVDLIVTQAVCEVCAVSFDDVVAIAERLPTRPTVISLDPSTLGEVLADVPRLAEAAGVPEAGERLVEEAAARHRRRGACRGGRAAAAYGGARVARPGLRGRPLGPADDRGGGRPRRARLPGRALADGRVVRGGGRGAGDGDLDAVRPVRGGGGRGDDAPARPARAARRAGGGGGRRGVLLEAGPAPGGRRGAARAPAASGAGAGARFAPLDRARPGSAGAAWP